MFHIKFDEISTKTVYTTLVMVDMVDESRTMICPYFGITFLIFFMKIEMRVLFTHLAKISNEHVKLTHNVTRAAQVLSSANKVLLAYGLLEEKLQKQHAFIY